MFGLFLFPLLVLCLLVGVVLAVVYYFSSGKENRPNLAKVFAIPFGCAAIPIVGLILLVTVSNLLQKSDEALAEEMFGAPTTLTDDRTLFDDFGRGQNREIYMRAEMTDAERRRLLSIPYAVESDLTLTQFEARGASKGFSWWVRTRPEDWNSCASARIRDAHGYNGWVEFRFAECLEGGTEPTQPVDKRNVYVIASHRQD